MSCWQSNMSERPDSIHPRLHFRAATQEERDAEVAGTAQPGAPESDEPVTTVFRSLPANVQIRILKHLLVQNDIVHAISRLDADEEPESLPVNCSGKTSLLHRFHVGESDVNLTYATKPQALLAPLLVSKLWNVFGTAMFYGENTFAFSSLGE